MGKNAGSRIGRCRFNPGISKLLEEWLPTSLCNTSLRLVEQKATCFLWLPVCFCILVHRHRRLIRAVGYAHKFVHGRTDVWAKEDLVHVTVCSGLLPRPLNLARV